MELFDLYDFHRQKLGKTLERDAIVPDGCGRIVVHGCIINRHGQMLIQQRAASKKVNPNVWDLSFGGCVQAGETSQQGAERELKEELDISHDLSSTIPHLTVNFIGGWDDYYIITKDVDIKSEVHFADREVQAVKWATCDEILKMIDNDTFIAYHKDLISLFFAMSKTSHGAFSRNIFEN